MDVFSYYSPEVRVTNDFIDKTQETYGDTVLQVVLIELIASFVLQAPIHNP